MSLSAAYPASPLSESLLCYPSRDHAQNALLHNCSRRTPRLRETVVAGTSSVLTGLQHDAPTNTTLRETRAGTSADMGMGRSGAAMTVFMRMDVTRGPSLLLSDRSKRCLCVSSVGSDSILQRREVAQRQCLVAERAEEPPQLFKSEALTRFLRRPRSYGRRHQRERGSERSLRLPLLFLSKG